MHDIGYKGIFTTMVYNYKYILVKINHVIEKLYITLVLNNVLST